MPLVMLLDSIWFSRYLLTFHKMTSVRMRVAPKVMTLLCTGSLPTIRLHHTAASNLCKVAKDDKYRRVYRVRGIPFNCSLTDTSRILRSSLGLGEDEDACELSSLTDSPYRQ